MFTYICIKLLQKCISCLAWLFLCCNYVAALFTEFSCILTVSYQNRIIFHIFCKYKATCFSILYDLPIDMHQSILSHRFCKGMAFHQCGLLQGISKWPLTLKAMCMVRLVRSVFTSRQLSINNNKNKTKIFSLILSSHRTESHSRLFPCMLSCKISQVKFLTVSFPKHMANIQFLTRVDSYVYNYLHINTSKQITVHF